MRIDYVYTNIQFPLPYQIEKDVWKKIKKDPERSLKIVSEHFPIAWPTAEIYVLIGSVLLSTVFTCVGWEGLAAFLGMGAAVMLIPLVHSFSTRSKAFDQRRAFAQQLKYLCDQKRNIGYDNFCAAYTSWRETQLLLRNL